MQFSIYSALFFFPLIANVLAEEKQLKEIQDIWNTIELIQHERE